MHAIAGILGFAAVLAGTVAMQRADSGFAGFLYPPAMLLVGLGPLCIALVSNKIDELLACAVEVGRCIRFSAVQSRTELAEELGKFAAELRRGKPAEALAMAESSSHPLLRDLAPLAVKQYSAEELERTASVAAFAQVSEMRRREDVLTGLARVAPAAGLVGTTLGLISLLKELRNFEQLGPSMALALLCTLYGLVLANGLYQPLARLVHARAAALQEESRLLTRALVLIGEGKPLADVRALFGGEGAAARAPASLAVGS